MSTSTNFSSFDTNSLASNSSTAPDTSTPGNAITGGYEGDSFTVRAVIVLFSALSMYNSIELLLLIFFTFSKFSGLYFWSLLVSSICVIPYALGFLFKFLMITTGNAKWLGVTFITVGWYGMVTGQSIVLWSRLHLLVQPGEKGQRTLRWTKWMIIIDAIILHIPTTVLTYGSNGSLNTAEFVTGYNVMEKIQMCGFFLQEIILSALYIKEAARLLRDSMRSDAKKFLIQLLGINVIIIILDIGLLSTEAASLYLYETIIKGTIYSIKLKLEFAVLGKLIHFVGGRPGTSTADAANAERWHQASVAFMGFEDDAKSTGSKVNGHGGMSTGVMPSAGGMDVSDVVDLSKIRSNYSHADSQHSEMSRVATAGMGGQRRGTIRARPGITDEDIDIARFLHMDNATLPDERRGNFGDSKGGRTGEGDV